MDKLIVGLSRSMVCVTVLASLAACGGGGGGESNAQPTADTHPSSVTPSTSNSAATPPSSSQPSNPAPAPAPAPTPDPVGETPVSPATPGNMAPQISGTPGTEVGVGQAYSFTPNATDADGDSLTFAITSKPSWASFNPATGRLWGTPAAGDVGAHEEIAISVTDGQSTRVLSQFAINVVQQSNGNVTLAWQAPTQNTDGSPLTNLNGYKIHYGSQSGNYTTTITVNNGGLTRYVVENLAAGTYYFAITAVSSTGVESDLSGEASKTI